LGLAEIVMNIRLILIGMVTGLLLPLAAANSGALSDPGLTQTGAGAEFVLGTTPSAGNFGRDEDQDKDDKDHGGDRCDKDHHDNYKCGHPCDKDHHDNDKCGHPCDKDRDDHKCDKSPSKPW
jgi:hypothetical protein